MKNISAKEVGRLLEENPTWKLIDVREDDEYASEHIADTLSLPLSQFSSRGHEIGQYEGIILMCRSGGRSAMACPYAEDMGVSHVYNLDGGIHAWVASGLPILRGDKGAIGKNTLIAFAILTVGLVAAFAILSGRDATSHATQATTQSIIQTVTPQQFAEEMTQPNITILDVRTPGEYSAGHLANANLVDFESVNFDSEIAKLPRESAYLIYCRSGNRSGQAVTKMRQLGFTNITELGHGINAWKEAGLPIVN